MTLEDIKKILSQDDEEARRMAIETLGAALDAAAAAAGGTDTCLDACPDIYEEPLRISLQALGDESWRVRKAATELISRNFLGCESLSGDLIGSLRAEENAGMRNSAVELLTRIGTPALPALFPTLKDPDGDIRKFVVDILGDIRDESALGPLLEALKDGDDNVRSAATEALGKLGGPEVIDGLIKTLADDDLWLRFSAMEALGKIGQGVPIKPLVEFLEDPVLKKAAVDALGATLDPGAIKHLIGALGDRSKRTREGAAVNLAKIYNSLSGKARTTAVEAIAAKADQALLAELFDSPSTKVKASAITLTGISAAKSGSLKDVKRLITLALDEELRDIVAGAFISMGAKGTEVLTEAYTGAEGRERSFICAVLGELGDGSALPTLITALKDSYGHTRQTALRALGRLGAADALPALMERLSDQYVDVVEAAVKAVIMIGKDHPGPVIEGLKSFNRGKGPATRRNVTTVFGRLGTKDVLPEVVSALKDEDKEVRKAAAAAFGILGFPEGLSHLTVALGDEETSVRLAAVGAIPGFTDEADLEERERLLALAATDEDLWVRSAALRGFTGSRSEQAIEALARAVTDEAPPVAISAIEALAKAAPKAPSDDKDAFATAIKDALSHNDPSVVKCAKDAIDAIDTIGAIDASDASGASDSPD